MAKGDRSKRDAIRCPYCNTRFGMPEDLAIHARFCEVRKTEEKKIRGGQWGEE